MSNQSQAQKDRVDREQEAVKEKGKEALEAARKIKKGEVEVEMPTTEKVTSTIQKGEESIERFQASDRGHQVGPAGQKVVEDVRKVLSDNEKLIAEKNQGDLLQNIVRDIWELLQELKDDPQLKELFEDWQSNLTSLMSSGDFIQFFQQSGGLFTSLKDTEEFLELLSQLIDLTKVITAEKTEQFTDKNPVALAEYNHQKEVESRRVQNELRATLRALSYNDVWRSFVYKGKEVAEDVKEAGKETVEKAKEAFRLLRDTSSFQSLVGDFKLLLQRLVGDSRSVDALFDSTKAALDDILNDSELSNLINELHRKLSMLTENPQLLDDKSTQQEFSKLADRADKAIERLRNSPNVTRAKKESTEIARCIKNDATSAQLLQDMKTLWADVTSDKQGEAIDADVLKSIRQMIIPLLLEHLNNVPLPVIKDRAEFLGKYDYTIDNMKISLPELIPENIHVRFEFEMDTNPLQLETTNQHTYLYLQASLIQLHLRDANFCYDRITIPKHSDSGIFDVDSSGEGLTIWMKMEIKTGEKDGKNYQYLDVLKSNVRVNRFNITFKESKHDTLYEMLTHLFQTRIKRGVVELIQEKLKLFGTYFSEQLLVLIDQARNKSLLLTEKAKNKTEEARHKLEELKLKAELKIEQAKPSGYSTEEAKASAKGVAGFAGEKTQEFLDAQKEKVEQKKREKELERSILSSEPPKSYQSL